MSKEKLVSLKEAALEAGLDENKLRKEIEEGKVRGERKNYLLWDEWFVAESEMDQLRDRSGSRRAHISTMAEIIAPDQLHESEARNVHDRYSSWRGEYREVMKRVAEEFVRPLLDKLESQAVELHEKEVLIAEQAQQLRLIPDFEARAEKDRLAIEAVYAEKHVKEAELAQLRSAKEEEVNKLSENVAQLQAEIAELRKPWWQKLFS